jgi:hypothetical protein
MPRRGFARGRAQRLPGEPAVGPLPDGHARSRWVDVGAGQLRRLDGGQVALGVDATVEGLGALFAAGVAVADVPARAAVDDDPRGEMNVELVLPGAGSSGPFNVS